MKDVLYGRVLQLGTWLTVLSALGLLVGRAYLRVLPVSYYVVVAALATMQGVVQAAALKVAKRNGARELMQMTLNHFMDGFSEAELRECGLRCNVMKLDGHVLGIVSHWGMNNAPDLKVTWTTDQGCCGLAVREAAPVLGDMSRYRGGRYEGLLHAEDHRPVWGITRDQWMLTRDVGSVVSVPLLAPKQLTARVIGVFNIDAQVGLNGWLPEEKREELLRRVQTVRGVLAYTLAAADY